MIENPAVSAPPAGAQTLRSSSIGAARSLACALVVMVHVNIYVQGAVDTWWPFGILSVPLFGVAVPTFLFLSGLSAPEIPDPWRSLVGFTQWLKRKTKQLLLPYVFWNVVTWLLLAGEGSDQDLVTGWLTGVWHLWFIFVVLQLLAISFILQQLLGRRWRVGMLMLGMLCTPAMLLWSDWMLWSGPSDGGLFEDTARKSFAIWILIYALGVWLRPRLDLLNRLLARLAWLSAIAIVCYLAYYLGLKAEERWVDGMPRLQFLVAGLPWEIVGPLWLLALLRQIENRRLFPSLLRALAAPSRYTYGIYLCHASVLILLAASADSLRLPIHGWIALPVFAIVVWVVSLFMVGRLADIKLRPRPSLVFGTSP